MVYPALLPLMRTPRLPVVDKIDADLNGLVRFARKTKSGFCACAITFQLASTNFILKSEVISESPYILQHPCNYLRTEIRRKGVRRAVIAK